MLRIDKNLENLIKYEEEYEKTHTVDYFLARWNTFANLYRTKLINSPFKRKYAKMYTQNMDILLKYTNMYSSNWLTYPIMHEQDDFLSSLARNIKNYRFPDKVSSIMNTLYTSIDEESPLRKEEIYNYKMLDAITDLKITSSKTFSDMFKHMTSEQQKIFLNLILQKHVTIDILYLNLDSDKKEFIKNNMLTFLEDSYNVLSFRDVFEDDKESLKIINDYIDNHPDKLVDAIVREVIKKESFDSRELKKFIKFLIEDIADSENVNISALKYLNGGSYSNVFQINDKIIKIGDVRKKVNFPNNPYILKPLLRKVIKFQDLDLFFEVSEKANNKFASQEDLYELYKNIRNLGLVWTDVDVRNAMYLEKDNVIHWKEDIDPSDEVLNFEPYRGESETLKKNSLVVIDSDFIFDENDPDITYVPGSFYDEFEERYQQEKNKEESSSSYQSGNKRL